MDPMKSSNKPAKPQELRTRFERWLFFLKFADLYGPEDTVLPENLAQEVGIVMALDSMRRAYAKDPIRELIEAREKAERDDLNRLHTARPPHPTLHATANPRSHGLIPFPIGRYYSDLAVKSKLRLRLRMPTAEGGPSVCRQI